MPQPGKITLLRGQHRLFNRLRNINVVISSFGIAADVVQHGRPTLEHDATLILAGHLFHITLPIGRPFRDAFAGNEVQEICIEIAAAKPLKINPAVVPDNSLDGRIFDAVLTPSFVEFYEACKPWIVKSFGEARANWPMLFKFGAVIRDAISHNRVRIDNRRITVSWSGITLSHADNGTEIIGPRLIYADMLAFMLDLASELDRHGAPNSL